MDLNVLRCVFEQITTSPRLNECQQVALPIDSRSGYQKMDELRSFIQLLNPIITLLFQKHRFSCHLFLLIRPLFQELSLLSVVLVNFLHVQSCILGNEFMVFSLQRCFSWSSHTFRSHPLEKKPTRLRSVIILGDPDVFPLQISLALTLPPFFFRDEGKT